jgi:putative RNA 2'-phosphotransferase
MKSSWVPAVDPSCAKAIPDIAGARALTYQGPMTHSPSPPDHGQPQVGRSKTAAGRIGRRLSYVLRHDPASVGLVPDPGGWVDVGKLLAALARHGVRGSRADLEAAVASDGKGRFTLSADGRRIRAAQGHSFPVDLGLAPSDPPDILYHGTARASLDAIFASGGLSPRSRRQVHLSADVETAVKVGTRHGRPVVLTVAAAAMAAEGHAFAMADNGVWLVDAVPARFLSFSEPSADGSPGGT